MLNIFKQKREISQDEEKIMNRFYPKREEFQWRPTPILCKRFDIIDPFMGKVNLSIFSIELGRVFFIHMISKTLFKVFLCAD